MIARLRLQRCCLETETAYTLARLKLLQALPGNPFGIAYRSSADGLLAAMARQLPRASVNRVSGLRAGFAAKIEPLRAWYQAAGVKGQFETVPGYCDPALGGELARLGYYQSAFEVCLVSAPPRRAAALEAAVERVASAARLEMWLAGFGDAPAQPCAALLRAGLAAPGWSIYLASIAGRPAAAAILFMQEAVGFCHLLTASLRRGEGVAQALVRRAMADAGEAGADVFFTLADLLSERQHGLVHMGLTVAFVRALWTPLASGRGSARPR
jgi:hypothetical protein